MSTQAQTLAGKITMNLDGFGRLATKDSQWGIQNTELFVALAVNAARDRNKQPPLTVLRQKEIKFIPDRTVTISVGDFRSSNLLYQLYEKKRVIQPVAVSMMEGKNFLKCQRVEKVTIVVLSLENLGFKGDSSGMPTVKGEEFSNQEFLNAWSRENLDHQVIELCSHEDGVLFCRDYGDDDQVNQNITFALGHPILYEAELEMENPARVNHYFTFEIKSVPSKEGVCLFSFADYRPSTHFFADQLFAFRLRDL